MEKIYIENFNNKKSNKNIKAIGVLLTSMLMVVVAIAAFVASGFNNVSYAVGDNQELGGYFKLGNDINGYPSNDTSTFFHVPTYYLATSATDTNNQVQVFCLDYNAKVEPDKMYSTEGENDIVDDEGLGYLLSLGKDDRLWNSFYTSFTKSGGTITDADKKMIKTWILQTAIWVYEHRTNGLPNILSSENVTDGHDWDRICKDSSCNELKDIGRLADPNGEVVFIEGPASSLVEGLVKAAKNVADSKNNFSINFPTNGFQKEDGDYVIAGPINVTNVVGVLLSYSVDIDTEIKDVKVIDSENKEISSSQSLEPTSKFYLKVPKSSLAADSKNVTVKIDGEFSANKARKYYCQGFQTITDLYTTTGNKQISVNIPLKYEVDVPDTGMTTAQTIYFVGLVVLLCGVGIVYANVKPKEAE